MRINTNISALNTWRGLSNSDTSLSKALEKLSSGSRINKAADDAAGLAISEKMRGQIKGLNQAARNAQDGISLIQTAEGALNETHSILQRMRELAIQSSNDTNTDSDRAEIQKELGQLKTEVDRISSSTEFNTKKLLNGEAGTKVNYESNADLSFSQITNADSITAGAKAINITTAAAKATHTGAVTANTGLTAGDNLSVTLNGTAINFKAGADNDATGTNFVTALNAAKIDITGSYDSGAHKITLTADVFGTAGNFTVYANSTAFTNLGLTADASTNRSLTGTNIAGTIDGLAAGGAGLVLTGTAGTNAVAVTLTEAANTVAAHGSVTVNKSLVTLQIGANSGQDISIGVSSMSTSDLGINNIDASTQAGSKSAVTALDTAISLVSSERSKLGGYQNRLEHTINNLGTAAENLTAAESRIRDVDMAREMMGFTRDQILSQAGTAMMAQANMKTQTVLKLLG